MDVDKSVAKAYARVEKMHAENLSMRKIRERENTMSVAPRCEALGVPDPSSGVDVRTGAYQRHAINLTNFGPRASSVSVLRSLGPSFALAGTILGTVLLAAVYQVEERFSSLVFGLLVAVGVLITLLAMYGNAKLVEKTLGRLRDHRQATDEASGFTKVEYVRRSQLPGFTHNEFMRLFNLAWGTEAGSVEHVALWNFACNAKSLTKQSSTISTLTSPSMEFKKVRDAYEDVLTDRFTVVNAPLLLDVNATSTRDFMELYLELVDDTSLQQDQVKVAALTQRWEIAYNTAFNVGDAQFSAEQKATAAKARQLLVLSVDKGATVAERELAAAKAEPLLDILRPSANRILV